ncbi:hypothetical protein BN1723_003457 [Verticillium longisporum]|uniref:Uncharacterized protein n=1 Tax=Verticillium longisporum TaxID=100787 RepID=A0A0G4LZ49_VERLO|nr:hypothetical protein BN1723_003457 [Verticillium longisporum]
MAMRDKMPAPLDLSRSKIFTGSPRMNLRRAASYNNDRHHYDKAPLSSTSSRFNFNHLLFTSPPPSPSLPALVPRPRRSPTHPRPSRMLRGLLWLTFFLLIFYFATITIRGNVPMGIPYLTNEQEFEMIGQDDLPDFATPIIVTDTGFFAPMFWSLGQSGQSPVNGVAGQTKKPQPTADAVRLRSYIGRAYMLDLAVLSGSSDVVICTVSAMGCRLLAVMMGWERAMEKDKWVNVDGDYGWTALSW